MASNTKSKKRGREEAEDRTESNKKAKVGANKLKTFFVLTDDKENLNKGALSFENNYLHLQDLTKLSNAASLGLAKTIQTTKLQAVTGMSQQDFEAEEEDWRSRMQALEREAADSKKKIAALEREAANSKKTIAGLLARITNLEATVESYSEKLTQHENISPHKKK